MDVSLGGMARKLFAAQDEIERLRAAIERADYYINRLEAVHRGHVVRDLDEACCGWESYKLRLNQQRKIEE